MIKTITVRYCDIESCKRALQDGETLHSVTVEGHTSDVCSDCKKHIEYLERELREFVVGAPKPHTVQVRHTSFAPPHVHHSYLNDN